MERLSTQDPKKHLEQRVGVLVDVANMYYSAKNLHSAKVDFGRVLGEATAGRKLIRALAYVVRADVEPEQDFFNALTKQGYEVREKDLQIFYGGAKKGDWDVGISVDAIKLADKLDVVVLVTGDGDFIPLVKYLQDNKGCRVEVVAFGKTTSSKLIETADDFLNLDESTQKFLIPNRRTRPVSRSVPPPRSVEVENSTPG